MISSNKPKFDLGSVVATPDAIEALSQSGQFLAEFLARHVRLDSGDLESEDQQANKDALVHGGRVFSAFHTKQNVKLWIITEADRSSTCCLLPSNY